MMGAKTLKTQRRSPVSAGILMYRHAGPRLEVLLVHPGGPYWRRKDEAAWSIPKGEMDGEQDAATVARREFAEETGVVLPAGPLEPLGEVRQRAGKRVIAFAVEGDLDVYAIRSNTFDMEWPPRSGKMQAFPEIDRAEWFDLTAAQKKIIDGQQPLLDRLAELVGPSGRSAAMNDPFDLKRFVDAQAQVYPRVVAELGRGQKQSHWVWFIFPQLAGLGFSAIAQRFAIASRDEAIAYLRHEILGPRLLECTRLVNAVEGKTIWQILGSPDDLKYRSSMTLFAAVSPEPEFRAAIDKYYDGEADHKTIELLGR
jgi:predicted NUDIX family NTP pyrophosphohydrolase/uncharacterized protein (DUF1810 family)